LEEKSNELVGKDLKFTTLFQPVEELQKEAIYLQPGLPTNKPLRTLRLENSWLCCRRRKPKSHSTSEVGKITITNVEAKEGNTIIGYTI